MNPRLYFDTSVFGGIYDSEFEKATRILFNMVRKGEIVCVYSGLTEIELERAPQMVIDHFLAIP